MNAKVRIDSCYSINLTECRRDKQKLAYPFSGHEQYQQITPAAQGGNSQLNGVK